jgi:hypothetical protein
LKFARCFFVCARLGTRRAPANAFIHTRTLFPRTNYRKLSALRERIAFERSPVSRLIGLLSTI